MAQDKLSLDEMLRLGEKVNNWREVSIDPKIRMYIGSFKGIKFKLRDLPRGYDIFVAYQGFSLGGYEGNIWTEHFHRLSDFYNKIKAGVESGKFKREEGKLSPREEVVNYAKSLLS